MGNATSNPEKKQSSNYQHRIDDKGNIVSVNGGITFNPNDKVHETYSGPTYDPEGIYDESDVYERWGYIKPESRRDVKEFNARQLDSYYDPQITPEQQSVIDAYNQKLAQQKPKKNAKKKGSKGGKKIYKKSNKSNKSNKSRKDNKSNKSRKDNKK